MTRTALRLCVSVFCLLLAGVASAGGPINFGDQVRSASTDGGPINFGD